MNLHKLKLKNSSRLMKIPQTNNNTVTDDTECYFKNIEKVLIKKISEADVVFGCVAWLTNTKILKALKKVKHGVRIVVQKEDFLRPDDVNFNTNQLYKSYTEIRPFLHGDYENIVTGTLLDELNTRQFSPDEAIQCMGNYNADNCIAFPRMHNKFLIFCKVTKSFKELLMSYESPSYIDFRDGEDDTTPMSKVTISNDVKCDGFVYTKPKPMIRPYAVWAPLEPPMKKGSTKLNFFSEDRQFKHYTHCYEQFRKCFIY